MADTQGLTTYVTFKKSKANIVKICQMNVQ